jgi:hypothetical protein
MLNYSGTTHFLFKELKKNTFSSSLQSKDVVKVFVFVTNHMLFTRFYIEQLMYSTADTDTMDILVNSTIINILSCTQDQHLHFSRHDGRLIMRRTHTQTYVRAWKN